MRLSALFFIFTAPIIAQNVKSDDVAGNEAVKKIMETRPGRGVMRDDTPPTPPLEALKKFKHRSDVAIDLMASEPIVEQPLTDLAWQSIRKGISSGRPWATEETMASLPSDERARWMRRPRGRPAKSHAPE